MARPRKHDRPRIVKAVCVAISGGTLVNTACDDEGVTAGQLRGWVAEDETLSALYARAREDQAHAIAEEALSIADEPTDTTEEVARNRLRVDTRKWMASKIAPRNYGEKVTHGTEDGKPIEHVVRGSIVWGGVEIPL